MYIRIKTITMKHSRKRRTLRLSISPTSPLREVANRLLNSAYLFLQRFMPPAAPFLWTPKEIGPPEA